MKYAVNEHFYTFQGEGANLGRAAYFIRLQGCDQSCWFCDSASTWHTDWIPEGVWRGDEVETARLVDAPSGAMVVLTGGEPCMYDLAPLVSELHRAGHLVAVETAGHRPVPSNADWITVSPKPFAHRPTPEAIEAADEFKLIISDQHSLDDALTVIGGAAAVSAGRSKVTRPIWLHPEWSHREDPKTLALITEAVKSDPRLRAGWQVHKLYRADQLDGKPVQFAPLGGVGDARPD